MAFAENLKEMLELKKVSQSELSRRTGINRAIISEYIHGKYEPKTENLVKIANALNVNPSELSDDYIVQSPPNTDNPAPTPKRQSDPKAEREAQELVDYLADRFHLEGLRKLKIDFASGSILKNGQKISDLDDPTILLCLQALSRELERSEREHDQRLRVELEFEDDEDEGK